MKKIALAAVLLISFSALADDNKPQKMTREDMLDMENVALKIEALQRQANELLAHRDEVLRKYGLRWGDPAVYIAADGAIRHAPPKK